MGFTTVSNSRAELVVADANDQTAGPPTLQQVDEGLGGVFKAVDDVLARLDPALLEPGIHLQEEFAVAMAIVGDEKALHPDAPGEQRVSQEPQTVLSACHAVVVG